jgi:hypothetical protein
LAVIQGGNVIGGARSTSFSYAVGSPAVGATAAVHAAVTDTGSPQVITTGITSPAVCRNVTATAGGTGTDINGVAITETLPAFTVDTAGTVVGSKAFATVTSITIPAHDGTGATTAVGTGAKLGLPRRLTRNSVANAYLAGVKEGTAPTIATDATNASGNTATLNSTLNGGAVVIDFTA